MLAHTVTTDHLGVYAKMQASVGAEGQLSLVVAVIAGSARSLFGLTPGPSSSAEWTIRAIKSCVRADSGRKIMACEPTCVPRRRGGDWGFQRSTKSHGLRKDNCKAGFKARAGLPRPISTAMPGTTLSASSSPVALTEGDETDGRATSALNDFIFDGSRTTAVAHKVWQGVVRPGDTVIDATCGNGHDTLMLAKLVLQQGTAGYVIGLDLQRSALNNTDYLLSRELSSDQREKVSLLQLCHSQLGKVVDDNSVRLVVFNLGYQPGGDKSIITRADTTVQAVAAAVRALEQQGLISITSYVGHPGGREEHDALREFVSTLPADKWVCSHLEWVNRPLCPHLTFLLKK